MDLFENLHADLISLLSGTNQTANDCYGKCLPSTIGNGSSNENTLPLKLSVKQIIDQCSGLTTSSEKQEREYTVAIIMGILGTLGLLGNLLSCVVIAAHLLKISGTFFLFLLLSIADSVVVVVQIIDAYRHSVWVDSYTQIHPEEISDPVATQRRDWNCKLFLYFWHLSLQYAAWVVMFLSMDRFISLRHIHVTHSRGYVYRRAWIIGGAILIFLMIANLPFLIYAQSAVSRTPCGFTHFCIYNARKMSSSTTNQTHPDSLEYLDVDMLLNDEQSSDLLSSRQISLWLSRQHLVIFGIVPYTVTFIFNIILIHYLRSCPRPLTMTRNGVCLNPSPRASCTPSNTSVRNRRRMSRIFRFFCMGSLEPHRQKSTGALPLISNLGTDPVKLTRTNGRTPLLHELPGVTSINHCILMPLNKNPVHLQARLINPHYKCYHKPIKPPFNTPTAQQNLHANRDSGNQHATNKKSDIQCFQLCEVAASTSVHRKSLEQEIKKDQRKNPVTNGWWVGQTRVTVLLLTVTLTFIVLTAPYMIYTELKQFHLVNVANVSNYRIAHLLEELCRFLLFLNNCLNFLIYMTGRQFRRGLQQLMRRLRRALAICPVFRQQQLQNQWYCHPPHRNRKRQLIGNRRNRKVACRVLYDRTGGRPRPIDYATPPDVHEYSFVPVNVQLHLFTPLQQRKWIPHNSPYA
ncbi:hypothetical protein CLF_100796 [Clonorchis sinensis]|uniref:G-protein coupled receptors family 1 profile domain-containing protein n=1 Tax=Clonorchis sinensis TaxID=79923 RepID=G7Y498_CLOSI|nr:hypothetical protein CLF_100796 [Clonorchis sinensis]